MKQEHRILAFSTAIFVAGCVLLALAHGFTTGVFAGMIGLSLLPLRSLG